MVLQVIQINPIHYFFSDVVLYLGEWLLVFKIFVDVGEHRESTTVKRAFSEPFRDTRLPWNVESISLHGGYCAENSNRISANLNKTLVLTFLPLNNLKTVLHQD
jgi:hypothetical protein